MRANHEREIVRAFFAPEKQPRYLSLLSTAKGRKKFVSQLAHLDALDTRFIYRIDPDKQTADAIEDHLKRRGAPALCHIMSEDSRIDCQQMTLRGALQSVVGFGIGTFLSCIAGRLAYFEGEEPGARYICKRTPATGIR